MNRRQFLRMAALAGLGTVAAPDDLFAQYRFLAPVKVGNPLLDYPNRDWERIYRDIYRTDRTFTFLCAPNATHNCLLRGVEAPASRPGRSAASRAIRPPAGRRPS